MQSYVHNRYQIGFHYSFSFSDYQKKNCSRNKQFWMEITNKISRASFVGKCISLNILWSERPLVGALCPRPKQVDNWLGKHSREFIKPLRNAFFRVGAGSQRFSEITRRVGGANGVRDMTFDLKGRSVGWGGPRWLQGRLLTGARRMRAGSSVLAAARFPCRWQFAGTYFLDTARPRRRCIQAGRGQTDQLASYLHVDGTLNTLSTREYKRQLHLWRSSVLRFWK